MEAFNTSLEDDLTRFHFNCSEYDFEKLPPNVTTHLAGMGAIGMGFAIGGAVSTAVLIALFFAKICCNIRKAPSSWRAPLTWITSMPMIISLLALATFLVPRAGAVCDIVKQSYIPFLLMHFIDLAVILDGGEDAVLDSLNEDEILFNLCVPLCCCFGIGCSKRVPTKRNFTFFKKLVYQAPLFQFILTIIMVILDIAELSSLIEPRIAEIIFQVFGLLNVLVFMIGNWGFKILVNAFKGPLKSNWNRSMRKATVLSLFILVLKLQNFVLSLVHFFHYIPCVPYAISPVTMTKTFDAGLSLVEALIFGIVFALVFKVPPALEVYSRNHKNNRLLR